MRVRVLGSAAGGGVPQWNCACDQCDAVRRGDPELEARTQDSVLVMSDDGEAAYLLNASPDVLTQMAKTPELRPRAMRDTPLAGVVLSSGDLDHCLGLLSLREDQPFSVYATREVQAQLRERNVLFRTLERSSTPISWRLLELDRTIELSRADGRSSGIELTPFGLAGKVPRHLEGMLDARPGVQIGLSLHQGRDTLVYASSVADLGEVERYLAFATCILFDGTFFRDDELARLGIGRRTAADMAHVPMGGERGSLARLPRFSSRRIYTHVNNTNPVLRQSSPERALVESAGWEVAHDGMEVLS